MNTEDRARERIIGGANALRTLAGHVEAHPSPASYTPAEVVNLLRTAATTLDEAVAR